MKLLLASKSPRRSELLRNAGFDFEVIPSGIDEGTIRRRLLDEYNIEIGGGLGAYKGKAWRIGLMGESATEHHVEALLAALKTSLS